jgi:plastocyanin
VVTACVLVLATAVGAEPTGQERDVTMPGKAFAPDDLQVLVGDTVVWRNGDVLTHTVTSDGDAFDSGRIAPGLTYSHVFAAPGRFPYHCTIHRFMRGRVVVLPVALSPPERPVLSGGVAVLRGLAPEGAERVSVEQVAPRGRTRLPVPAADGSFTVRARVIVPTTFRARAGAAASPPIRVAVAPNVSARVTGDLLVGSVEPARPGAEALAQVYDRERFDWRTVARSVVRGSRATVSLVGVERGHVRLLVRGGRGWADGASLAISVG